MSDIELDIAGQLEKAMNARKETEKEPHEKKEKAKEQCPHCKKLYADIDRHVSSCKENPENKKTQVDDSEYRKELEKMSLDIETFKAEIGKIMELKEKASDEKMKVLLEKRENKRKPSPSEVYSEMMKFCENSDNEIFKKLREHATDVRKHWRSIIVQVIDALYAMDKL